MVAKNNTTNGKSTPSRCSRDMLLNFTSGSYLERTARPVYAVLFLLPFIILYEVGTITINTNILNHSQVRVVAFVWMQELLQSIGLGGKFAWAAPGLAVIIILLSQQVTSRKDWHVWLGDFVPMLIECTLLAIPLIVLTFFLNFMSVNIEKQHLSSDNSYTITADINSPETGTVASDSSRNASILASPALENQKHSVWANIVTGIGAGIYEELVFRLVLICILLMVLQDVFKMSHGSAIALAVCVSAALFSAHHHIDFLTGMENTADPFDWAKFTFRTIAGVYFAFLYAIRGFGITAGTHSFYNIIAVSITAGFFK